MIRAVAMSWTYAVSAHFSMTQPASLSAEHWLFLCAPLSRKLADACLRLFVLRVAGAETLAQVTSLVQLRLLVAINSGTTEVRLESCRYKCNVRRARTLLSLCPLPSSDLSLSVSFPLFPPPLPPSPCSLWLLRPSVLSLFRAGVAQVDHATAEQLASGFQPSIDLKDYFK